MRKFLLLLLFLLINNFSYGQNRIDLAEGKSIKTIYEYYKDRLDKGDTIKRRSKVYGMCQYESLIQIIKKNDSTLIINSITTPCLEYISNKNSKIGVQLINTVMPSIELFEYTPYSIEIPLNVLNWWNFNIKDASGKISIINHRKKNSENTVIHYVPYKLYDLNFIEFLELADLTKNMYKIDDYINDNYFHNKDLFSKSHIQSFGENPSFYINNMWGIYVTNHFIVILENVQANKLSSDESGLDYRSTFIKMAESIKPIHPNTFDLKEIENYLIEDYN